MLDEDSSAFNLNPGFVSLRRYVWAVDLLTFARETSGAGHPCVELEPGGADVGVTDANKARYVALLVRHRTTHVRGCATARAVAGMRAGLRDVVPRPLLEGFSAAELDLAVCGVQVGMRNRGSDWSTLCN